MEMRALGRTGLRVSAVSLGTVKLGRNRGVKYPEPFDLPSDEEARDLLAVAAELGINLLDTAPAYGASEERLGRLLAGFPGVFHVSTKVGEEFEDGQSRFDFSPEHARRSVERSLRRLGRETLDVVLVHSDGSDVEIVERAGTLDALADLRREGKVRAFGLSAKTVAGARAAMAGSDVLMLTLHPGDTAMLPVVREAHAAGVGVLVKKALRSGHLGADDGEDPVEASMRFVLREPGVSSVVTGTINPAHVRHNVAAAARAVGRSNDDLTEP